MAAWRDLVAEKPGSTFSIREITDRAEVSVGTFYCHFRDKGALTEEVALDCFAKLVRELERIPQRVQEDFESRIQAAVEVLVDFAEHRPKELTFLFHMSSSETEEGQEFLAVWQQFWDEQIETLVSGYLADHPLHPDIVPAVAGRASWGAGEKVLSWWMRNPRRLSRKSLVRSLTRILVHGYC